jgi:hypothetical protein
MTQYDDTLQHFKKSKKYFVSLLRKIATTKQKQKKHILFIQFCHNSNHIEWCEDNKKISEQR